MLVKHVILIKRIMENDDHNDDTVIDDNTISDSNNVRWVSRPMPELIKNVTIEVGPPSADEFIELYNQLYMVDNYQNGHDERDEPPRKKLKKN